MASVGTGALLNTRVILDHESRVGAFAHVGPGCAIAGRVTIGEGSFIGIGSTVIDQIKIGSWAIVGAGSVVVEHLPSNVTAYGVPARVHNNTP
jgi:acetyltransferase-like isoleucine patch superfamily enzyme